MQGFTLIELAVVMMLVTLLAMLTTPSMMNEINQRRASATVEETQLIVDAARSYRMSTGAWPGNATCSDALTILKSGSSPMLVGVGALNKYNSPISTSCTALTFSVDQNAVQDWDGYIVNSMAGTEIVNSGQSQLRTTIGIPGSEPALNSKLSRIATGNAELNRMRTTLLLGGNDITEIENIEAVSANLSGGLDVKQAAVIGGLLASKGKSQFEKEASFDDVVVLNKVVIEGPAVGGCKTGAIARNSAGATLSCQSGVWKTFGGTDKWGGSYWTATHTKGGCPNANPYTGSCSCPAGFTPVQSFAIQVGGCNPCRSFNCFRQ